MIFNVYVGRTIIMEGMLHASPGELRPGDTISMTGPTRGPYATVSSVALVGVGKYLVNCLNHSNIFFEFPANHDEIFHVIRIMVDPTIIDPSRHIPRRRDGKLLYT